MRTHFHFHTPSLRRVAAAVVVAVVVVLRVTAQDDTGTTNARWSPDGSHIATVDGQNILHIWDSTNAELINQFAITNEGFAEISWSPDGSQIAASTSRDFMVRIWDIETGGLLQTLEVFPSNEEGMSVEWQPNGNHLAAVAFGEHERLFIWEDTAQGFQTLESESFTSLTYDLRWSPSGQQLAYADFAGIHVIKDFASLPISAKPISGRTTFWFVWSPDSSKIAGLWSADNITLENSIQVIDVQTGTVLMTMAESEQFLGDLSWSTNSDTITTRGEDGVYHIWDIASQKMIESFTLDQEISPYAIASPYGGRFAVPPSTDASPLEIVVLSESIERVQGIAKRCLADTDNLTSAVTAVLNEPVINSLTELTLPSFVSAVEALPSGTIPVACSADLVAVAEAVIAGE